MANAKWCVIALVGVLGTACASAAEAGSARSVRIELSQNSPLLGGWTGRIGKHQVIVCFARNVTQYYYLSHLSGRSLILSPQDDAGRNWTEADDLGLTSQPTGHWVFNGTTGDALEGTWSDPEGRSTLPIRLARFKDSAGLVGRCDFRAMQAAQGIHPEQVEAGDEQVLQGVHYRVLSALNGSVSTIEFLDAEGKYDAHNRKLRKELQEEIGQGLECQETVAGLNWGAFGWPYTSRVRPSALHGNRWVTLQKSLDYACGGAHPNAESNLETVDLFSGKDVHPERWVRHDKDGNLPKKLDQMITRQVLAQLKATRGGDDCDNVYAGEGRISGGYVIELGNNGMVFYASLPHVVYACTEYVEIPYDRLQPYLTQEGREAISQLSGNAPAKPPETGR
jgi:hypothetical protein